MIFLQELDSDFIFYGTVVRSSKCITTLFFDQSSHCTTILLECSEAFPIEFRFGSKISPSKDADGCIKCLRIQCTFMGPSLMN